MKPAPKEEMFQSTPDDAKRLSHARKSLLFIGCGCMGVAGALILLWLYVYSL